MADIKLIALDLDGTLLTTDKKLTDRTKATLKAAREQGVKVVLTTGRPLKAMDFFLKELGTVVMMTNILLLSMVDWFRKIRVRFLIRQSFQLMM